MPSYLTRRRRVWYAVLDIPKALRPKFGKRRFIRTLQTDSLAVAQRRSPVLIAQWKGDLAAALDEAPDDDAAYWNRMLQKAKTAKERQEAMQAIELVAENLASPSYAHGPGVEPGDTKGARETAEQQATEFLERATGQRVRLADHIEPWAEQQGLTPRTRHRAVIDIQRFAEYCPEVQDIDRKRVQQYVDRLSGEGLSPGTIRKQLSHMRALWRYLQRYELAPETEPFSSPHVPKNKGQERVAFTTEEIQRLMDRADPQLYCAMAIAAHSGLRLDEITSLRLEDVTEKAFQVRGGKTDAAAREVPIHRDIVHITEELKARSTDGYLFSGVSEDKWGKRSGLFSYRFSKLKRDMGFPPEKVFHSLRHFVSTSLEQAEVPEVVAARILGHRLNTMSYGVYSGGVGLDVKREALEKAIRL